MDDCKHCGGCAKCEPCTHCKNHCRNCGKPIAAPIQHYFYSSTPYLGQQYQNPQYIYTTATQTANQNQQATDFRARYQTLLKETNAEIS